MNSRVTHLSPEELDRARAEEAFRLVGISSTSSRTLDHATLAARLAREGWEPADPLEGEIEAILADFRKWPSWLEPFHEIARRALERGMEMERERQPNPIYPLTLVDRETFARFEPDALGIPTMFCVWPQQPSPYHGVVTAEWRPGRKT